MSKKIIDFHIIDGHASTVERRVNEMIKKGYTLHGDLIKQVVDGTEVLVQSVVKYKNKTKKIKKVSILSFRHSDVLESKINDSLSLGYEILKIFKRLEGQVAIMVKYE